MKTRNLLEKIFHFLPFWIFGIAFLVKIVLLLAEFSLTFAENKKLLYDFQDSWMGRDELPGVIFLLSFILSFIWMFLIFFLRRKKELTDRWCCAIGFFLFPIIMCFIINLLPHRPDKFRREYNHRMGCRSHIKQLSYGLAMYAHDNNDFYPDNLEMISSYFGGCSGADADTHGRVRMQMGESLGTDTKNNSLHQPYRYVRGAGAVGYFSF